MPASLEAAGSRPSVLDRVRRWRRVQQLFKTEATIDDEAFEDDDRGQGEQMGAVRKKKKVVRRVFVKRHHIKRPDFLPLIDPCLEDNGCCVDEDHNEVDLSAKTRLLQIVRDEKGDSSLTDGQKQTPPHPHPRPPKGDDEDDLSPTSLFQRGTDFVRTSIRKIVTKGRGSRRGRLLKAGPDSDPGAGAKSKGAVCTDSQDSGLGEDSECETTSPRTPTPATSGGIIRPATTSSLRKVSSTSESIVKKHVIIREPSLSHLPSSARQQKQQVVVSSYLRHQSRETVRIYPTSTKLPLIRRQIEGSVSSQWSRLFSMAYAEVMQNVSNCDTFTIKLIFEPNQDFVRRDIVELATAEDVALLIHSVYRVLFFDWLNPGSKFNHLSIVIHCVQRFLVIVVDVAVMDIHDKIRFARLFRNLLRASIQSHYRDLVHSLNRTRDLYVRFWSSLMLVVDDDDDTALSKHDRCQI